VRPFMEATSHLNNIQIMGGIGSAALTHQETMIVPDEKRVIAPADLSLPQYRPDGNLRDFDALVLSTSQARVDEVKEIAKETIGDELELSFFELKPLARLQTQRMEPFRSLGQFVSDRYVIETDEEGIIMARRSLFPFEVAVDFETLDTWSLSIGDKDPRPTPIPHPGTTILNYLTRSVSGLRPKDEAKVNEIAKNVVNKAPETKDWLMDGPGRSQMEFARIFHKLGRGGTLVVGEQVEITPVKGSLLDHPAFMITDAPSPTQRIALGVTYAKARILHAFESNERVVTLWQRMGEKHVDKIVHNE